MSAFAGVAAFLGGEFGVVHVMAITTFPPATHVFSKGDSFDRALTMLAGRSERKGGSGLGLDWDGVVGHVCTSGVEK